MLRERLTAATVVAGSTSRKVCWLFSKLGKTAPFFVTPKAKVNSVYYCYEVLARGLLRDIRQLSGIDGYIFQQNGAPAHLSRHTVAYLNANVPELIDRRTGHRTSGFKPG